MFWLFTDSPPVSPNERRQTRVGLFAAVTNKEILQIIKQAVAEIHEEGGENRFGGFKR